MFFESFLIFFYVLCSSQFKLFFDSNLPFFKIVAQTIFFLFSRRGQWFFVLGVLEGSIEILSWITFEIFLCSILQRIRVHLFNLALTTRVKISNHDAIQIIYTFECFHLQRTCPPCPSSIANWNNYSFSFSLSIFMMGRKLKIIFMNEFYLLLVKP